MQEYCLYVRLDMQKSAFGPILASFASNPFWLGSGWEELEPLFCRLHKEAHSSAPGAHESTQALLTLVLVGIVRLYTHRPLLPQPLQNQAADAKSLAIERYFLSEYADASLEALSERIHVSPRQTERLLQDFYGKTFQQMKLEAKMARAALLLRADDSISAISAALGFSSPEHFAGTFKRYYGISAREYRKQLQRI